MDQTTDYKSYDINNLIFEKTEIKINQEPRKVNVYADAKKLKKLILVTPILSAPFGMKQMSSKSFVTVSLTPSQNERKQFVVFLKALDEKIENKFSVYEKSYKTSIQKNFMVLNMPRANRNFSFNSYDVNRNLLQLNDQVLCKNTTLMAFIELTDIWFSEMAYGCNWNILQLKLYPKLDFSQYMFNDSDDEENITHSKQNNNCFHISCPNCSNTIKIEIKVSGGCSIPPPPPMDYMSYTSYAPPPLAPPLIIPDKQNSEPTYRPSLDDILNGRMRLKPVGKKIVQPVTPKAPVIGKPTVADILGARKKLKSQTKVTTKVTTKTKKKKI